MRVERHAAVSIIVAGFIAWFFKSIHLGIVSLIIGIFLDIDHFFDYFNNRGFDLNLKRFGRFFKNHEFNKLYLFLHSYELIIPVWIVCYLKNEYLLGIVITISFFQHMFLDQVFNRVHKLGYFFSYRLYKKFNGKSYFGFPSIFHTFVLNKRKK